MKTYPQLALVPGEPAGIGPELCVKLAHRDHQCKLTVFADPENLLQAANRLRLNLTCRKPGDVCGIGELAVHPIALPEPVQFGHINPLNSALVISALQLAGQSCIEGKFDGLITGPVHKAAVNAAGIAYTGTTELLAEQAGVDVVMMLANPHLRVALATTHLALRDVADAIRTESLEKTIRILNKTLQLQFNINLPKIIVLGLNPHAGEHGVLGNEEINTIIPVLEKLRAEGFLLEGPLPADTAFLPKRIQASDAILAMYHDQGLPVLKYSGFDNAVNITLGLPYPRVAVDHGTALEIAGLGIANDESLWQAVGLCRKLALSGKSS